MEHYNVVAIAANATTVADHQHPTLAKELKKHFQRMHHHYLFSKAENEAVANTTCLDEIINDASRGWPGNMFHDPTLAPKQCELNFLIKLAYIVAISHLVDFARLSCSTSYNELLDLKNRIVDSLRDCGIEALINDIKEVVKSESNELKSKCAKAGLERRLQQDPIAIKERIKSRIDNMTKGRQEKSAFTVGSCHPLEREDQANNIVEAFRLDHERGTGNYRPYMPVAFKDDLDATKKYIMDLGENVSLLSAARASGPYFDKITESGLKKRQDELFADSVRRENQWFGAIILLAQPTRPSKDPYVHTYVCCGKCRECFLTKRKNPHMCYGVETAKSDEGTESETGEAVVESDEIVLGKGKTVNTKKAEKVVTNVDHQTLISIMYPHEMFEQATLKEQTDILEWIDDRQTAVDKISFTKTTTGHNPRELAKASIEKHGAPRYRLVYSVLEEVAAETSCLGRFINETLQSLDVEQLGRLKKRIIFEPGNIDNDPSREEYERLWRVTMAVDVLLAFCGWCKLDRLLRSENCNKISDKPLIVEDSWAYSYLQFPRAKSSKLETEIPSSKTPQAEDPEASKAKNSVSKASETPAPKATKTSASNALGPKSSKTKASISDELDWDASCAFLSWK
ncbi:hypothetical protein BG015_002784 [Linnemannia schmuckeri]|uniref:Uncharacterized protein n=1 Tax=Linnemannia schmuckeri TaxID=64567 RepID=A0A9P5RQK7_9FUNG|nr:hypothetical protein BG015_002784 [Linnemannia schmuckeri]